MEGLPKLLPIWHSVTLKETAEKKKWKTPMHMYPDHGGCGVDVFYSENGVKCEELKSAVNIVEFGAKTCALPLLQPNKVDSLFDPCLGKLLQEKEKERELFFRYYGIWNAMKLVPSFRECMQKFLVEAPEHAKKGEFDKIRAPACMVDLAKNFPKKFPNPRARWSFTGGCITTLNPLSSECLLLHPIGRKMDSLALTPIREKNEEPYGIQADDAGQKKIVMSGRGGRIFQISTATMPLSVHSDAFCVRQRKMYNYVRVTSSEKDIDNYPMISYSFEEELSDIKLSNYIPGEHIVITVGGNLFLQDAEEKKTIWQLPKSLSHDAFVEDKWWGCEFGSHPRSVLYADRLQFSSVDLRSNSPKCTSIVSLPNQFFQDSEQIMMTKQLDVNQFQYILATDLHMFVFDERYPQQPMNVWNHMLESIPLYCEIRPYRTNSDTTELVAVLGSQKSQDIAAFHMSSSLSHVQPFSLSHPCHLSSPRDCIKHLELQCVHIHDDLSKRLSLPLIGTCVVPYVKSTGYSVIQLTSLGDVFYQDFFLFDNLSNREKTFRVEPGCSLTPASEILEGMSSWMEEAIVSKDSKNRFPSEGVSYMYADRDEILEGLLSSKRASDCVICKLPDRFEIHELDDYDNRSIGQDLVDSDICPRCGLYVEYGKQLVQKMEELGVLSGPLPGYSNADDEFNEENFRTLELVDFDEITDPLSKMILSEWPERKGKHSGEVGESRVEASGSVGVLQEESLLQLSSQASLNENQSYETTDFMSTQTSALDESFINPSQDLFPSQEAQSPAVKINKPKRIKLSSSLGF